MQEAKERLEVLQHATYQTAPNALARYYHLLRPGTLLGDTLCSQLAAPDFDDWYRAAEQTQSGMVGSAHFDWPMDTSEAVALQLELIRRLAEGELDLLQVSYTFTYSDNHFDANIHQFFATVVVPFHNGALRVLRPLLEREEASEKAAEAEKREPLPFHFIDRRRLSELSAIESTDFDLSKVIALVKEIDFCYRNECLLAVAALTRALLDHVPPIFGMRSFAEVASSYASTKSFRDSMRHLEESARRIGDAHLHTRIRRREALPTPTQVNFSNDIDVLLGEIVRVLS